MNTTNGPADRLPPASTVTFLFTDIEGSATLVQNYPDELYLLLEQNNNIICQSIEGHNGHVFHIIGDVFALAFHTSGDAVGAVLEAQSRE